MIFELARDFQDAVAAMPAGHPKHRMLKLLEEALRRDIHFIDRHATTLFQCMWNSCWWYDCPEAAEHYVGGKPPSLQVQNAGCSKTDESSAPTLSSLLQRWRDTKEGDFPGFQWVVALRPPALHLGAGYKAVFTGSGRPCFSPDGSLIAVTCGASVRVFDIDSGAEVVVLRGHQANVTSVCFSHDGCRVVTGSLDKTVRVWDLCGAQEQTVFACACDVKSVAYSPDGSQIAAASGPVVHLWNAHTGHESAILKGQRGRIWNISYSPNGSWIAAGDDSDEGVARIWDTRIGAEVGTLEVGAININTRGRVLCVRFSPDGRFIATGSFDRMIRLYDSETHIEVSVLEGHLGIVFDVCFSPDGRRIASASEDETVRLWDVPRGEEIDVKPRAGGQVRGVTFSPVGSLLATSSSGLVSGSGKAISANKVRVWDASIDQKMVSLRGHNRVYSDPRTVTYSPDGSLIATKSWSDRTLRVWDAASGIELAVCHDAEGGCDGRPAVWSPDSSQIAFKTLEDNMRIWDVFRNRKLVEVSSLQYGSEILNYSADGDRIIVRDGFSTIRVYDLRKTLWTRFRNVLFGRELLRLDGHNDHVRCLSLAPDGSRIVTCSEDGKVRLWDARTTPWARLRYLLRNRNLAVVQGHQCSIESIAYSPDGSRIATGSDSEEETVRIWDARSCALQAVLPGHKGGVDSMFFPRVGSRFVTRSIDVLREWNTFNWVCTREIVGHADMARIGLHSPCFIWKTSDLANESIIFDRKTCQPVAHYPETLGREVAAHPSGRSWAGDGANHLEIVRLEGDL